MLRLDERPNSDFGFDSYLPPLEAWNVDPRKLKKFYAPTDDRGFVMAEEAVAKVNELIDDDYEWPVNHNIPSARPNSHHLHYYEQSYRRDPAAYAWRNTRQVTLPNQNHRLWHEVVLPPNLPRLIEMKRDLARRALGSSLLNNAKRLDKSYGEIDIVSDASEQVCDIVINELVRLERGWHVSLDVFRKQPGARHIDWTYLENQQSHDEYTSRVVRSLGNTGINSSVSFMHRFKTKYIEPAEEMAMAG